jgi:phosphoribosylanthranilate isomerase
MTQIKICCMGSIEEAELAIRHGASAVGLVSEMPSGPGPISDELIHQIAAAVKPPTKTFLLTCKPDVGTIAGQVRRAGVTTVQVVDHIVLGTQRDLREALYDVEIVQVIHVRGELSVAEAVAAAPFVDALLLDSGNQSLAVKELGGTGRVHDWEVSRKIVSAVDVPVWLAGGLNAGNVGEAIRRVQPHGVDVCSGVRTNGKLDPAKLEAFTRAVAEVPRGRVTPEPRAG